jgi:Peptidase family M23
MLVKKEGYHMKVKINGNNFMEYEITSNFGEIDPIWHKVPHTGIDFSMSEGTELYSPIDGIVSRVVNYGSENIGKGVIIKSNDGHNVILGHLSDNSQVYVGQKVKQGDFVGLSGGTGHSSAPHLHLGLKDENGNFVNPEPLLNDNSITLNDTVFQKEGILSKMSNTDNSDVGFMDGAKSFGAFLKEWKEEGSFFEAMYDKSFFETLKDFTWQLIQDFYTFIITNGDLFFILPAIIIMFVTFMIGRNKFTKWIVPLWFAFFVSKVLILLECLPPQ